MENTLSKSFGIWDKLTPHQRELILQNTIYKKFNKGTILYHGGGECTGLEIIKSGRARAFITSPNGGEITLYRLFDYDICVLSAACMIKNLDFEIHLEFELDTEVYIIPKNIYKKVSDENSIIKDFTLELVSARFSDTMWVFNQFVFSNVAKRLAESLIEHSILFSSETLSITHDTLAKDLGTAREVVTRLLKQLQLDNIVELSRGKIKILDLNKLRNI